MCWKEKHNNTGLRAAAFTELRISGRIVDFGHNFKQLLLQHLFKGVCVGGGICILLSTFLLDFLVMSVYSAI